MSDRNDNIESISNRKTTKTTTNINSTASKKSETHSKEEMQQTDCDIQGDQQCRPTTTKHSNNDNKGKNHSITSDTLTSDNSSNEPNPKMQQNHLQNDQPVQHSVDDHSVDDHSVDAHSVDDHSVDAPQSDQPINSKQEHNNNDNSVTPKLSNPIKLKNDSFADENTSRNGSAKKKVQVRFDYFYYFTLIIISKYSNNSISV